MKCGEGIVPGALVVAEGFGAGFSPDYDFAPAIVVCNTVETNVGVYWVDRKSRPFGGWFCEKFRRVSNQPENVEPNVLGKLGRDPFETSMILAAMGITQPQEEEDDGVQESKP